MTRIRRMHIDLHISGSEPPPIRSEPPLLGPESPPHRIAGNSAQASFRHDERPAFDMPYTAGATHAGSRV